jgi:hypothetical protein
MICRPPQSGCGPLGVADARPGARGLRRTLCDGRSRRQKLRFGRVGFWRRAVQATDDGGSVAGEFDPNTLRRGGKLRWDEQPARAVRPRPPRSGAGDPRQQGVGHSRTTQAPQRPQPRTHPPRAGEPSARYSRGMRHIWVLLTCTLAAPLAVGASAAVGSQAQTAEAPPDAVVRGCRSRGEAGVPIRMPVTRSDVRIGPLVIGNVRTRTAVGPTDDPEWPFVAKAPVLLPARSRVVLAIAPEATTRAAFQHREWVSAVRFTGCFERVRAWSYRGTVGRTTFFPFAIAIRQRTACIPMELWIDGRSAPVRGVVPVGRRTC